MENNSKKVINISVTKATHRKIEELMHQTEYPTLGYTVKMAVENELKRVKK